MSLCLKKELELEKQGTEKSVCRKRGSIWRLLGASHHPCQVCYKYTLQPPQKDCRAAFYTSEKNSGTSQGNSLIHKYEGKRLFKTTAVTGKPLAQVKAEPW